MCWQVLNRKILESRNHEIECSLSDILEDNVPEKYYLSRNKRKSSYKKKSQRKVNESTHRKDLAVLLQAVRVDLAVIRDFISLKIL